MLDTIKAQLEIYTVVRQGLLDLKKQNIQVNNKYQADKKKVIDDLIIGFDTESDNMYAMEIHVSYQEDLCHGLQFYRVTKNCKSNLSTNIIEYLK